MNVLLSKIWPHLAAVGVFLIVCAVYFSPQIQGKVIQQGDITQYLGMSQEIREFKEETGQKTLWTNAMFGGMPTYQISSVRDGNLLKPVKKASNLWISRPIGLFISAMISFYIMMVVLGVNPWLSIIGAIAFGFTTNNFVLFEAGHNSKLDAIAFLPLMAAGILLAFRKQYLAGGALFAMGTGLNLLSNHPQMSYYFVLTLIVYGVAQLIFSIRKGELMHFLKASGILLAGGLLGLGASMANILVTLEYTEDTMRGKPVLEKKAEKASENDSSETEGLAWNYAMNWSNGTIDLFSTLIPGVAGGSSSEPLPEDSEFAQLVRRSGQRLPDNFRAPLYWGGLPNTAGPNYMGAGICLLFILGLILVKGPAKWWLGIGTLLTFMLSLGSNLEWFNRIFFEYFPLFNKFRSPNSVLSVTAFLVPFLGLLAVNELFKEDLQKSKALKALYIATGITGSICLYFWIIGPSSFDFSSDVDPMLEQNGFDINAVKADRAKLMSGDAARSLFIVILFAGLLWAFLQNYISKIILMAGLGLITVVDLALVGQRYLGQESFVTRSQSMEVYNPRQVDQQIMSDTDPHFRVHDLTQDPWNSARASYFHKTVGGYHAAKLQRYQDLISRYLSKNDPKVLNMLNTKYVIVPGQNGQAIAQRNPEALGNAWMVNRVKMVNSANEEIDAIGAIDPGKEAIVHQEYSAYVSDIVPNAAADSLSGDQIKLTSYAPNELKYTVNNTANGAKLAVFSEIWYGPDKGWNAYIDEEQVDHIRVNYLLRGLKIPPGQHDIVFKFEPATYYLGNTISIISSLTILLAFFGFVGYKGYQQWKVIQATPPAPKPKPEAKAANPTTPKRTGSATSRPQNKRSSKKTKKKK